VSEATLRDALSEKLGLQSVDLTQIVVDSMALKLVPRDSPNTHRLPGRRVDREARKLIIASPTRTTSWRWTMVRAQLRGEFALESRLAGEGEIGRAIDQYTPRFFRSTASCTKIETGEIDYQSLQASGRRLFATGRAPHFGVLARLPSSDSASDIHFRA